MPTYEYICNACGHEFEKFQPITAAPIKACVKCGKKKAERKISGGAGFIFKGGGFYETDYRSDSYKKAAEADKAPAATSDSKPADAAKPAEAKAAESPKVEAAPAATPAKAEAKPAKKASKAKS